MNKPVKIIKLDFTKKDVKTILKDIKSSILNGNLTLGKNVNLFEDDFKKFIQCNHCVATNSGTSALEIIFRALNIENQEVLIPSNTFVATAYAVIAAGGTPVIVDCNPETLSMDPLDLKKKISTKSSVVTIVHIAGIISPQTNEIISICKKNNLKLVEDAAHAHGSVSGDLKAGNIGIAAAFSLFPTKVITACEGGLITTKSKKISLLAKKLRVFGQSSRYEHDLYGYNWRLSELHAIVGRNQLSQLKKRLEKRKKIARIYDKFIYSQKIIDNYPLSQNQNSSYYKYVVRIKGIKFKKIQEYFHRFSINLPGKVYGVPLHEQTSLQQYSSGKFPGTEKICQEHFCLPMYPRLKKKEIYRVINVLKNLKN